MLPRLVPDVPGPRNRSVSGDAFQACRGRVALARAADRDRGRKRAAIVNAAGIAELEGRCGPLDRDRRGRGGRG